MNRKFNSLARILLPLGWLASGCEPAPSPSTTAEKVPVAVSLPRLVVVDNDPLAEAIRREWRARTGDKLEVESMDGPAWRQALDDHRPLAEMADAVIYPTPFLGTLAEAGQILPAPDYVFLPEDGHDVLAESDILPAIRRTELRWGGRWMAMPFSSAPLLLVYRADLLQQCSLAVPRTWEELHRCATVLEERRQAGELPPGVKAVLAQPLAPDWAATSLLARVSSAIRDASRYSDVFEMTTMEPRIASVPFVQCLEALIADQQMAVDRRLAPSGVYAQVRDGEVALGIGCWPVRQDSSDDQSTPPLMGFALLPGSRKTYSHRDHTWIARDEVLQVPLLAAAGHVGSVVNGTRRQRLAWNLLRQLASPEWSRSLAPAGQFAAPFRESQLADLRPWLGEELADESMTQLRSSLEGYFGASVTMTQLRIPFAQQYLRVLDDAVNRALDGDATAEEALQRAAEEWSRLVEQHGRERQAEAYLTGFSLMQTP